MIIPVDNQIMSFPNLNEREREKEVCDQQAETEWER